jgi:hypothetical protein
VSNRSEAAAYSITSSARASSASEAKYPGGLQVDDELKPEELDVTSGRWLREQLKAGAKLEDFAVY